MRSRGLGKCGLVSLAIAERGERGRKRGSESSKRMMQRESESASQEAVAFSPCSAFSVLPSAKYPTQTLAAGNAGHPRDSCAYLPVSPHGPRSRARERESQGVANLFGAYNCVYMFIGTHRPRHATEYRHSCTERTAALSRQSLALVLMCAPVAPRATRPLVAPWLVSSSRSTA